MPAPGRAGIREVHVNRIQRIPRGRKETMRSPLRTLAAAILGIGFAISAISSASAAKSMVWADGLPKNLDPHAVYDVPMQIYMLNVYDGLYRYQGNPPALEPWLATGHTVSDDGLTWDFQLREGVRFHDGSELTAEDVVYSVRRILALGKAPSGAFRAVLKSENVTAPDTYTVRFVLDRAVRAVPVRASRSSPSSTPGSWKRTPRTATWARPGCRPTPPARAPTPSIRTATGLRRRSTFTATRTISWAGITTPIRSTRSEFGSSSRPRPGSSRSSRATSMPRTATSRRTRSSASPRPTGWASPGTSRCACSSSA